jgi:hypothetical protein
VVDLRKAWIDDLRRHEVGQHFFHPDIVEPPHSHQIAEPHVGRLMSDHAGAPQKLALRGGGVEQETRSVIQDGAGVLHAAELEGGDQHQIEFPPRVRDRSVFLQPGQGARVQVEDCVAIASDLCGVGFAMKHAEGASVAFGGLHLELTGCEGEQVGRQRHGFRESRDSAAVGCFTAGLRAVGGCLPGGRKIKGERVTRLQAGLVEAGKRKMGARRNKEGVQEFIVAIERFVAGEEFNPDGIFAGLDGSGGNNDVPVHEVERRRFAVGLQR